MKTLHLSSRVEVLALCYLAILGFVLFAPPSIKKTRQRRETPHRSTTHEDLLWKRQMETIINGRKIPPAEGFKQ